VGKVTLTEEDGHQGQNLFNIYIWTSRRVDQRLVKSLYYQGNSKSPFPVNFRMFLGGEKSK
jgi:type IV secretory pathway VirB3-like protein